MSLKNDEKETKGIRASFILEMIGRPPEHLVETMGKIINQMDEEKGTKVLSKDIKEPVELKDNKEFFSTFAEVDIEVEEIANLAILLFKYMPSHLEIVEPELIALTNNGWNDILNELTRRLHGYDEVARVLQFRNAELQKKLEELIPTEKSENKEIKNSKKKN
jgi:hypothetical protein